MCVVVGLLCFFFVNTVGKKCPKEASRPREGEWREL